MNEPCRDGENPGIGRLNFFVAKVGITVALVVAVSLLGPGNSLLAPIGLVLSIASFVLDVMRLRNIGVSQWFAFLRFAPYVNLLYMIFLQSAQPGWSSTRRLDNTGKTLIVFQAALLVVIMILLWNARILVPDLLLF